jgi:hypothetical protein
MKEASKYESVSDVGDSDSDSDYCEEEEGWGKEWSGIALKTGSAGKTSPHSMPYYMACMKCIMQATPEVTRELQTIMIKFLQDVCPDLEMAEDWQSQLMANETLKVLFLLLHAHTYIRIHTCTYTHPHLPHMPPPPFFYHAVRAVLVLPTGSPPRCSAVV